MRALSGAFQRGQEKVQRQTRPQEVVLGLLLVLILEMPLVVQQAVGSSPYPGRLCLETRRAPCLDPLRPAGKVSMEIWVPQRRRSLRSSEEPRSSANKGSSSVSPLPTADSPAAGLSPPLGKKVSARQENGEAHEVNITEPTRAKLFKLHIDEAEPNASADGSHQEKEGPAKTTSDGAGALSGNGNDARANEGTWKCLGVGELRVKKSKDGEKMRVVMRREYGRDPKGRNTGGAVSLNLALQKHVLCERVEGERDFRLTAASSNGNPVTYLIRVRNASDRDRLWRTICDALKSISR